MCFGLSTGGKSTGNAKGVRLKTTLWFVYVARCSDGSLYTGVTTDPARRGEAAVRSWVDQLIVQGILTRGSDKRVEPIVRGGVALFQLPPSFKQDMPSATRADALEG